MYETRIARRYLWAARKEAHTAFLSAISTLGLSVGVATLLISIALLSGLQGQIKSRLIASSPHLLIEPAGSNTIDDAGAIAEAARRLGMKSVRPVISGMALGTNEEQPRSGRALRLRSSEEASGDGIVLTHDTAASLSLERGDLVTLVAPRTRLTPFGPVPVWRKYRVEKLVTRTGEEHSFDAFLSPAEADRLLGTNGKPTSIEMYGNVEQAEAVQAELARRFPAVQVKTWKEINRPLFLALRLEKIVMFATISLIIFVAALNLVSSLSMVIVEKRPSVGILRTLGATERSIHSIFLQVGLLIGIAGTVIGNVFGIGISWAANRYHLVPLPPDLYFLGYLPFTLDAWDVAGVNAIAILLSIVATWYPAHVAARLDPVVAIREE
ncbi:MAG TPA: FtsX-like permease family protein [Thermoanaerobaculia bacterium]|nr:FtsX-like permease family protein [Thermoanaerobaculia bacterium]